MHIVTWLPECLHWPFRLGVFIAILAFTAAAVTFRKEPGPRERSMWIFVFLGLMCAEVRMMSKDRNENNRKDKETGDTEIKNFKAVGDEIQSSNAISQAQFSATMAGLKQNSDTVTGGDSFCYLDFEPALNDVFIATAMRVGKYPLRGISLMLTDRAK